MDKKLMLSWLQNQKPQITGIDMLSRNLNEIALNRTTKTSGLPNQSLVDAAAKITAQSKAREQAIAAERARRKEDLKESTPPGEKYERMVHHIKGKNPTEKQEGIAYATAWKKYKKDVGEDSTKLFEYVTRGTVTHDAENDPLSPAQSARRRDRIARIVQIGRKAVAANDTLTKMRAANSLIAKGANAGYSDPTAKYDSVSDALATGGKIQIQQGGVFDRIAADQEQREGSLRRRLKIQNQKNTESNTF